MPPNIAALQQITLWARSEHPSTRPRPLRPQKSGLSECGTAAPYPRYIGCLRCRQLPAVGRFWNDKVQHPSKDRRATSKGSTRFMAGDAETYQPLSIAPGFSVQTPDGWVSTIIERPGDALIQIS